MKWGKSLVKYVSAWWGVLRTKRGYLPRKAQFGAGD